MKDLAIVGVTGTQGRQLRESLGREAEMAYKWEKREEQWKEQH